MSGKSAASESSPQAPSAGPFEPARGAARTASFTALLPPTTLLLAIPALGEWPSARDIAGAVLAATGVLLATGIARR